MIISHLKDKDFLIDGMHDGIYSIDMMENVQMNLHKNILWWRILKNQWLYINHFQITTFDNYYVE